MTGSAVQQRHLDADTPESAGAEQTTETAADDEHSRASITHLASTSSTFRTRSASNAYRPDQFADRVPGVFS
jgi:hypothetical protein